MISDVILMEGEMTQIFQDTVSLVSKKGKNIEDGCLPVSQDPRHFLIRVFVACPVWGRRVIQIKKLTVQR